MNNPNIITRDNIKEGAKLTRKNIIFIIDKIVKDTRFGILIYSSYEGGEKGNYCDILEDFLLFINEK